MHFPDRRNGLSLLSVKKPLFQQIFPNHEWRLYLAVTAEIILFAFLARNFWTGANAGEIVRLAVEVGLLAIALTPVIVTGGIDLSVGSLMGLCAVIFGMAWKDWGLGIVPAALVTLTAGALAGGLNAWVITRFRAAPLIVTLATYSLFRGLAEGLTQALRSVSGFPQEFLFWGQGHLTWGIPAQAAVLECWALTFWVLLERSTIGRAWYAIGNSAEGARFAAVPVARRTALAYVLSGFSAAMAALIYVAHTGQAKSDAGNGYELMAITAVVLGGTSIFGGRGTVFGTLLGLFALAILRNGLRLAGLPAELVGILTGVLLIVTIGVDRLRSAGRSAKSQAFALVAVAAAIILAAGGAFWFRGGFAPPSSSAKHRITVAMMPKAKGDPYFISCRKGAEEAAQELGIDLIWDGPTELDTAKQNEVVEGWITRGVDVIAVSVENQAAISTVLRKARKQGIKVLTWDADALPDARDFLVNQATAQGIGSTLADQAALLLGGKGEFAIVTGALSAANQNMWIGFIRERLAEKYPDVKLVTVRPSDDDRDRAFTESQTLMKVYPKLGAIVGISAPAVPGIAEATKQAGRPDVKVTGLSLPNLCKPYVHSGFISSVVLWNTRDLGYLTVLAGEALVTGRLKAGDATFAAGRLGTIQIKGDQILLGAPFVFDRKNIDGFDF
jgi:rhamnose transport system substrate-binding protein